MLIIDVLEKKKVVEILHKISEITECYDVYFTDVWGVLYHEGVGVLPTALQGLHALKEAEKTVVLISNASKSGDLLAAFLEQEGIPRVLYHRVITSGDCTRTYFESLGKPTACYLMGRSYNRGLFRGLPMTFVEEPEQADIFVTCAPHMDSLSIDPFLPLLDRCLAAGLPMLCANPDEYVLIKDQKIVRSGLFAQYYAEKGGSVMFFGKPHEPIYKGAHAFVLGTPKKRLIAIGDGLKTDILGAKNFGIDSVWIRSGVDSKTTETSIVPTYVMDCFQ
ncbi:MAG: TIGR01459 family HAD-type hydrolase [Holosporales bacterium]|jgi:HAD superfamily hydrolase (TIGR01459 family)|nr:TIGR01459 family HAD-type hydrolase [Holosporales bacterium]